MSGLSLSGVVFWIGSPQRQKRRSQAAFSQKLRYRSACAIDNVFLDRRNRPQRQRSPRCRSAAKAAGSQVVMVGVSTDLIAFQTAPAILCRRAIVRTQWTAAAERK